MTQRRYMSVDENDFDPISDDQADQYSYEEPQEDLGYLSDDSPYSPSMSEAVRRIQLAKLYEALLSQSFFAAGSTRDPSIQQQVESEIKEFIHRRLEELLGLRSEAVQPIQTQIQLPFDEDQLEALVYLANRTLKRAPATTPQPIVNITTPTISEPVVQQAQVPQITKTTVRSDVTPNTLKPEPSQSVIAQPLQRRGATQQQNADNRRGSQRRRKDSENVSEKTGKDFSQAVGKRHKPKAMPSQVIMDAMNAQAAELNASSSPVLNQAAKAAQQSNTGASVGAVLAQVLSQANGSKS